ncbi:MAG: hypothetical protein ACOH2V_07855 [Candidatus Saccharimonadaceae bacterium]
MKIFMNDEEIRVFNGATVIDVVRVYYVQRNKKLSDILPLVTDGYGNSVAPDGELNDGNHLYIKTKANQQ